MRNLFSRVNLISLFIQHTSLSPDGKLLVIVGDDPEGMMVDSRTGKVYEFFLAPDRCIEALYHDAVILIFMSIFAGNCIFSWSLGLHICLGMAPWWINLCNWEPG